MMPAIKQQSDILLSALLNGIKVIDVESDCVINSVQIDSRLLGVGDLFVALSGSTEHALSYLNDVLASGAVCIMYARDDAEKYQQQLNNCRDKIIQIEIDSVRDVLGVILSRFYNEPSKQLDVIGITGTDGKTSVSRFIAQALSIDTKTAVIGTTGNGIWGELVPATHTTPDVVSLHKILFDLKNESASTVVMEVSSHGIEQKRIAGVDINTAVLTNVSRDHLDYHGTIENYRNIKKQLFNLESINNVVVNLDDEIGNELAIALHETKNVWGYSLKPVEQVKFNSVYAKTITTNANGFSVEAVTPLGLVEFNLPLLGRFNVSNALTVLCVLLLNNIELTEAASRIEQIQTAPGRMECFKSKENPLVVVDFAHTPKALELALQAMSEHCKGKVWCVFGCGGDRDQGKRPLMAAAAEKYSDNVVLTDDNPRNEKSENILEQVLVGFENKNQVTVISSRKAAIEYAIENASVNDVVLVAGKGHEEFQLIGDLKIPFSDRVEVQRIIGGDKAC